MALPSARNSSLHSYHQHYHLLLQFIWSELMLAYQHVEDAYHLVMDHGNVDQLVPHLATLVGSSREYMRLFSWEDDNVLTRLKNNCSFLPEKDKDHSSIASEAHKAWVLSLHIIDIVRSPTSSKNHTKLLSLIAQLRRKIARIKKIIPQIALKFSSNENVVFFILRHQEKLDAVHGKKFVKKILRKMFGGTTELEHFLTIKYAQRGFSHLMPIIQTKIAQLKST